MTQATEEPLSSSNEEISGQIEPIAKTNKKTKVTVYLTEEAERAFAELYINRYRNDRKIDRSTIACEAIQALFAKELGFED